MVKNKKPIDPKEQAIIDAFVNNMQIGIVGPESGGDYNAQNPRSTAAGKYQFTNFWLKNAKDKSIQSYAKRSNGLFKVPDSLEDFKKDKMLQDAYFRYYAREVLYDKAKKAYNGPNPKNITLEEIGALFHYQGEPSGIKQLKTGIFNPKDDKNMDVLSYLKIFSKTIEESPHANFIKKEALLNLDGPKKKDIVMEFVKRDEAIKSNKDLSEAQRGIMQKALYQSVVDKGYTDVINDFIKSENDNTKHDYDSRRNLEELLRNTSLIYGTIKKANREEAVVKVGDRGDLKKAKEQFPKLFPKGSYSKEGLIRIDLSVLNPMIENGDLALDLKSISEGVEDKAVFSKTGRLSFEKKVKAPSQNIIYNEKKYKEYTERSLIDPEFYKRKTRTYSLEQIQKEEKAKNKETSKTGTLTGEKESAIEKAKKTAEEIKKGKDSNSLGLTDEYYANLKKINSVETQHFNYAPGKKELPIDAIMGMSLGLIGNTQAKAAKIPLRTEDVSQAFKSYTAELAKLAKQGLPVEVEAQMKSTLAEVYQGGLKQLTNASGGNSALILGNLGQLEQAKNKGLMAIQIADYEAKDRAFSKYGEALKYMDDFNSRRDIANHNIRYREAKTKQQEGKALATAGFAKLIDDLKYQKENGPGSANDMARSMYMQKIFGFDPKMEDNGKGDIVGTKSNYDKLKTDKHISYKKEMGIYTSFQELSPKAKASFDQVFAETKDPKVLNGFIDYLKTGVDPDKIKLDNLDLAIKNDDFRALTVERRSYNPQGLTRTQKEPILRGVTFPATEIPTNSIVSENNLVSDSLTANFDEHPKEAGLLNDYYNNQ